MKSTRGYWLEGSREAARRRNICPAIPYRMNSTERATFFPKLLYKGRARIEQAVGNSNDLRAALRCEKTARNYGLFVALACAFIFIKSVHTT
jgi:hypothetical protein